MHKKTFLISSLILVVMFLVSSISFAEIVDDDKGIYMYRSKITDCWVGPSEEDLTVVFSDNTDAYVDISEGDVGEQLGAYGLDKKVPVPITIGFLKVRTSNAIVVKAWLKDDEDNYWVTDDSSDTKTSLFTGSGVPAESDCAEVTLNPTEGGMDEYSEDTVAITGEAVTVTDPETVVNTFIQFDEDALLQLMDAPGDTKMILAGGGTESDQPIVTVTTE